MIEVGRIAMLDNTRETLELLTMSGTIGDTPTGLEANGDIFAALRKYVLHYNLVALQACEAHQLTGRFASICTCPTG